jgi:hypothetical protein
MKNASCHDDKMEAYCNVVGALEDKFYGLELNHVPRKYDEEADELAKITSGRITVPPNVFTRDVASPSVNFESTPSSQEDAGAPSNPTGIEPMDEDPSNEAFMLSLLEGYDAGEAEAMDAEPAPREEDWQAKYFPQIVPKPNASPRWPNRSPLSTASFTSVPHQVSCRGAYPFRRGASSSATSTRACAATTQRRAPSWATRSTRASTGPPRSRTPTRLCAPARGANSTPARPTSQGTPSRRSLSRGLLPCGDWTLSGPYERCPGATPTCWSPSTSSPNGSSCAQS